MAINISKPDAQLPRNAFDLSQRHVFTSRVGYQVPILALDCIPGDFHSINTLNLTRTLPLNTDAFTTLRQNFSFIFVPYQQIWRYWNDFINQSNEHFSTLEGTVDSSDGRFDPYTPLAVPVFSLYGLILRLHTMYYIITDTTQDDSTRFLRSDANAGGMSPFEVLELIDGVLRLLDMLGYGQYYDYVYNNVDPAETSLWDDCFPSYNPNMFRLCAYQKAWFDYSRNTIYDGGNTAAFNLDHIHTSTPYSFDPLDRLIAEMRQWVNDQTTIVDLETALAPFVLRNAQWNRDKFTSMYPQPQFGSVSGVSFSGINIINDLSNNDGSSASVSTASSSPANALHRSGTAPSLTSNWSVPNAFNVYELRYAQMIQKWKEDKMRAGKRTKDIAQAIFGERPKYAMDTYSDFVDNFTDYINISEVTSTSATDGASLGEIAGKGVGAGNHTVKFSCSDYGVLLCLYDVVPSVEYNSYMLDKQNTMVSKESFYDPYMMDQGFEAVTLSELCSVTRRDNTTVVYDGNKVLGYAPHDQCYKQAVNKVHGEFSSGRTFSHWVTPRTALFERIQNSNTANLGNLQISDMYVHPEDVDAIFVPQTLADYGDSIWFQENDQLINNVNFEIKSVRNLSVLGLPRW